MRKGWRGNEGSRQVIDSSLIGTRFLFQLFPSLEFFQQGRRFILRYVLIDNLFPLTVFQRVIRVNLPLVTFLALGENTSWKPGNGLLQTGEHLLAPLEFVPEHAGDDLILFHHFHAIHSDLT